MSFNYTFSLLGKCLKCQGKQTIKINSPATGELLQCKQRGPGLLQPLPRVCRGRKWCGGASFLSCYHPWNRHHVLQAAVCQFPSGKLGILPPATTGVRGNQQHWLRLGSASLPQHRMRPIPLTEKYTKGNEMPRASPTAGPKANLATLALRPNQEESSSARLITSNHSKRNKSQFSHQACWGLGGKEKKVQSRY